jgi:sugar O-acyltransferase (sialic acid O-acetyltransferase NeuD family)
MREILLFGSGGYSNVVVDILEKNRVKIKGYIDINKNKKSNMKYLGNISENLKLLKIKKTIGFIAIGNNYIRKEVYETIYKINPDFKWERLIDPSCIVSNSTKIGEGSIIVAGSVVNARTIIGKHCIINTKNSIDHDNIIDDFSSTGPSVTTGGTVKIGKTSHIGMSSTLQNNIKIGSNTIIGSCSYVNKNCLSNNLYFGKPAKKKKIWKFGKNYL